MIEDQRGCGRGLNMEEDGKCCVREVGESRVEWADIQSLISLSPLLAPCELLEPQEDHKQNLRQTSLSPLQTPLFICTKSTREVSCKSSLRSGRERGVMGNDGKIWSRGRHVLGSDEHAEVSDRKVTINHDDRSRTTAKKTQSLGARQTTGGRSVFTRRIVYHLHSAQSGVHPDTHSPERYASGTSSSGFRPNRNSSASF